MLYRSVGKTGMSASIIGLGAEHLDGKPYEVVEETIHAAIEKDINMIDCFMPGKEIRQHIGKALKGKRDKVMIQGHIGSVDINKQYDISRDLSVCEKYFDDLLRYLETDYIDFGMMFFIDSEKDFQGVFDTGFVTYVQKLKQQGKIRAIGASSHNPEMARRVVETGVVDMLMFSINPAFDMMPFDIDVLSADIKSQEYFGIDPVRQQFYQLCEQQDVGITVMKTLGAGKMISAEHTPFARPLSVGQCIHYALSRPAVVSAMVGCQSREHILEAVKYLTLTDEEKDYSDVVSSFKGTFEGKCVYCNHCLPCPSNINIASVNKYLDIAMLDKNNIPPSIAQHYGSLDSHGSDCIACGSCEGKCPFNVPIIENMAKAAGVFGK